MSINIIKYNNCYLRLIVGKDFKPNQVLDVPSQVEKLIQQAISVENLCQCYIGW